MNNGASQRFFRQKAERERFGTEMWNIIQKDDDRMLSAEMMCQRHVGG